MDSATLARQIQDYDSKRVNSTDALNEALKQYGVPEIRNTVAGLRTTLANTQNAFNAVDPSVTGRTQGSLVTEAQRTKQVSNERAPIAGQMSDTTRALGDQTTALNDAQSQANMLATNRVNDWETGRKALQGQYDTAYQREQDAQALALKQQELAASRAQASQRSSASTDKAANRSNAISTLESVLKSKLGKKDGYASPYDYNAAKSAFVSDGYSASEFDAIFGKYKNPKQPKGQYK